MDNPNDLDRIKALDKSNVFGSLKAFPDQCLDAWTQSSQITFPQEYQHIKNIVVAGMGGSRFTPLTIKHLYQDQIKLPYEIIEGYNLPAYVNSNSLVILSSYSGTTEEVISCANQALKANAKLTGITSGGTVAKLLKGHDLPFYQFHPRHNPSGQPRVGSGYLLLGHLGLLSALNLVNTPPSEVISAVNFIRRLDLKPAKQLASILKNKHVSIVAAEFLKGFANGFANQLNETAKSISDYRFIPELNHHLMEGLSHPQAFQKYGLFVFVNSSLYSHKIKQRFSITQEIVTKQHLATHTLNLTGKTKLAQILEAFTFSGLATFHLAMLYNLDPASIPWVNYFKQKLETKS